MLGRDSHSFEEAEFWSCWWRALRRRGTELWEWVAGSEGRTHWHRGPGHTILSSATEEPGISRWKSGMQNGASHDWFHKAPWWQERSFYLSYLRTKWVPVPGLEPKGNTADSVPRIGRGDSRSHVFSPQEIVTPNTGVSGSAQIHPCVAHFKCSPLIITSANNYCTSSTCQAQCIALYSYFMYSSPQLWVVSTVIIIFFLQISETKAWKG